MLCHLLGPAHQEFRIWYLPDSQGQKARHGLLRSQRPPPALALHLGCRSPSVGVSTSLSGNRVWGTLIFGNPLIRFSVGLKDGVLTLILDVKAGPSYSLPQRGACFLYIDRRDCENTSCLAQSFPSVLDIDSRSRESSWDRAQGNNAEFKKRTPAAMSCIPGHVAHPQNPVIQYTLTEMPLLGSKGVSFAFHTPSL